MRYYVNTMKDNIKINSSLINSDEFKFVKQSLINASEKDGKADYRVKTLEYINDSCENANDMYFYDMLEFVRFLDPSDPNTKEHVAYTTPNCLIYFNMPNEHIKNVRQWDFTHDHECLHQLWDTFGVADRIKSEGHEYNHMVMNIASDCVINQYLRDIRGKECADGLITPESIKKDFNVDYNAKEDTQYSLYLKLLSAAKQQQDALDKFLNQHPELKDDNESGQQGQGQGQQGPSQPGGQGQSGQSGKPSQGGQGGQGGQSGQPGQSGQSGESANDAAKRAQAAADKAKENASKSDSADADKNAKDAQAAADKAKEAADKAKNASSGKEKDEATKAAQDAADKAEKIAKGSESANDAAKRAQAAADKAKENASKSGSAEDKKKAERVQAAADKAKKAADKANKASDGKEKDEATKEAQEAADEAEFINGTQEGEGDESSQNGGKGIGSEAASTNIESKEDLEKIRNQAKRIIEKYKDKIAGDFGDFIRKCKSSIKLEKSGLKVETTQRGSTGWSTKMKAYVNAFVKKKIFQKKREFESTYKRMNRRQGVVNPGDIIKKGKRVKKNGLDINTAFYIDRSGSMGGDPIKNVFTAAYAICESLKKQFKRDKVVDNISFKMHAFDTKMHELEFGKKINADGGTMPFHEILNYIGKNTKDYMINIIITDAEFDINESEVEKLIKDIDGMILFITNNENETMKDLAKKYQTQLYYILSDINFTLKD